MTFFIIFIFILLGLLSYYLITRLLKFSFIKKINNKFIRIICVLIPIIVISLIFNYMDTIVILLHLTLFLFLSELFFKIFIHKRKTKYIEGIWAIIITIIYLSIGAYLNYHVFETHYVVETEKDIKSDLRIIQISDAHIKTTFDGKGFRKHIEKISKIKADLVVITGDFVDDDTKYDDMLEATKALELLNPTYGIYFIYGNHDKGYFNYRNFNNNDLVNALKDYVIILEDDKIAINDSFILIGRKDKSDKNRKTIQELTKDIDYSKYLIVLDHQPNDYKNEMEASVDLVLSGHSHGGQLIPLSLIGKIIKANDMFYGIKKENKTTFIVNSGISDWAISFKTGTFSEYGVIDIKKTS